MVASITTSGLQNLNNPVAATFTGQWALATGTGDVITVSYPTPNTSLTDGLLLAFRASAANLTTTPTFSPDGQLAAIIVKYNLAALAAGDIQGSGAECLVRYNLTSNVWVLLNPTF